MKITMYELLGKVKDGKAPKKIKIDNNILTLSKTNTIQYNFEHCGQLSWDYYIENYRLDEKIVEVLDKDFKLEEKKIPEKIKYYDDIIAWVIDGVGKLSNVDKVIIDKLNDVIDYLKSKGDE